MNELGLKKKIVMRIKGNKAEEAKKLVDESNMELYWFDEVG